MTKPTNQTPWASTFRRIRAMYRPEWKYPPRPTAAELDAAEEELGCPLPLSYRAFAEEFGLGGDFLNLPKILPLNRPSWANESDWFRSVLDATRFYRTNEWREREAGPSQTFFKRVVLFAIDGGYHHWVFDPLQPTNFKLREYRILDVDRTKQATVIADSFADWLQWVGENYRFNDEDEEASIPKNPEFQPIFKPDSHDPESMTYWRDSSSFKRKKKPKPQNVKQWLAWNKGTVRNLAQAIREENRNALFSILADALEEAGCNHQDLLNSCRNGDPDIDGVWVLQVLLGKPPKK